jgi:hypothetical protein
MPELQNQTTSEPKTFISKLKTLIKELRPNIIWDITKWTLKTIYVVGGAVMSTSILSAYLLYFLTSQLSWGFILGLFILSLVLILVAFLLGNWQKKYQKEFTAELGEVKEREITETKVEVIEVKANHKRPILKTLSFVTVGIFILSAGFLIGKSTNTSANANTNANTNASTNTFANFIANANTNINASVDANANTFIFNADAKLKEVKNKTFINERVPLDGHSYKDCIFTNVKFVYNGTSRTEITRSSFNGLIGTYSDNPTVSSTIDMMKGLGFTIDGFQIMDDGKPSTNVTSPKIKPLSRKK